MPCARSSDRARWPPRMPSTLQPLETQAKPCEPLVAARPGALLALLVPALEPLGGADGAVRALEHAALGRVISLLCCAPVVLVVPRVAVPRLRQPN